MKSAFSTRWKSSKKPAKQRKYRHNAPLHTQHKFLSAHLSKELRKKHGKRSMPVVKGDKVKIVRGQYKGRENKIDRINIKSIKIYITGVERTKKDGSKSMIPVNPSNLMITELNLSDKKRKQAIERKTGTKKAEQPTAGKPKEETTKAEKAEQPAEEKTGAESKEEK